MLDDSPNDLATATARSGRPLRRRGRRIRHNLIILTAGLAGGWAAGVLFAPNSVRTQISAGTAYVGLVCVALSLVLGPLNLLRDRPNPVSNDLRRDFGIWGGIVSLVHVGVGLTVHFRGKMHLYFFPPPKTGTGPPVVTYAFLAANHLGLVAGIVLVILLALSSDRALRLAGATRWKRWQRLNYIGAVAIVGHGLLYQIIERQRAGFVLLFILVLIVALGAQLLGIRRLRRGGATAAQAGLAADQVSEA